VGEIPASKEHRLDLERAAELKAGPLDLVPALDAHDRSLPSLAEANISEI
jgi:hypothetical protein